MKLKIVNASIAAALILVACGGGGSGGTDAGGGEETTAPEVPSGDITYLATEFAFEGPDTIGAGETTFTLQNQGEQPHMIIMVELLQGKTIDDVHTYIKEHGIQGKPPKWAKEVKVEAFAKPGKTDTAKPVDLTAGTYALLCFVPDKEEKKTHAELGMAKQLTVE